MVRRVLFGGEPERAVAQAFATTTKTVEKWVDRYQAEGLAGLEDRSSRPRRLRSPTPVETVARIIELRRQRFTGKQIAKETGVSRTTVSRRLRAARLSRAKDLEPVAPVVRYERASPGELIHLDIKKLGLKHIRTRPYTPRTNGKAERFIQTALREWAYAQPYPSSAHRAAELPIWLHRYNWHRPHAGIKSLTPISRLGLDRDNLSRLHS
jgi:transposase-like protein